jgi:hypothetical protein
MERMTNGGRPGDGSVRSAALSGIGRMRAARGMWTRRFREWLSATTYRPERHYMRGGR